MVQLKEYDHYLMGMITGKLLGDGSITVQSGRKPRFQFTHSAADSEWSRHCYEHLKEHLPLSPPKYRKLVDSRIKKGYTESYIVLSRTSPIITALEPIWYHNRKKVVPADFTEKYFNTNSLAWWYQDDGNLNIDKRSKTPRKIILSTDSFTIEGNLFLISFFKSKYGLNFNLDKQNRLVIYNAFEICYFLYLVEPYMHVSMNRKMMPMLPPLKTIVDRRTTLYLPDYITISKPTETINEKLIGLNTIIDYLEKGEFYNKIYQQKHLLLESLSVKKSYQIVVKGEHLNKLRTLKHLTGLTYSELATLCFIL